MLPISPKNSKPPEAKKTLDPFFGLRYIAYLRTGMPVNEEDMDESVLANFAKWQLCKARNRLWLDPIWDAYTYEELLIELFAVQFDEDAELRTKFEAGLVTANRSDEDWMARMEARHRAKAEAAAQAEQSKIVVENASPADPNEFEEKF